MMNILMNNIFSRMRYMAVLACATTFVACSNQTVTPDDASALTDFHNTYFNKGINEIAEDQLALYVDYSQCIAMGQHAPFFQALVPSWTNATKHFYAIKGSVIEEYQADSTFLLLRNIENTSYADLKTAAERIAAGNTEAVLLTDGEYFQPSVAKGNVNNPYMADALKTWLKKGHDVYIIAEPYTEPYNGAQYAKKRFYFLFTDNRLKGNIYDRVMQTVKLEDYAGVEVFHLSADHPQLLTKNGATVQPSAHLNAKVDRGAGTYEVQTWEIDWKDGIEPLLVNAVDANTGEALPQGESFATGLKVDRNSFGGYRITDVSVKVYDINQAYTDFCMAKEANTKPEVTLSLASSEYFITMDAEEWQSHGIINLHFDTQNYNPDAVLTGRPFNYFKVDLCVSAVEPLFAQYKGMFTFDSIDMPGQKNVSVAASVEQCLTDPEIKAMISTCPLYTIYVKSNQR